MACSYYTASTLLLAWPWAEHQFELQLGIRFVPSDTGCTLSAPSLATLPPCYLVKAALGESTTPVRPQTCCSIS